MHPPRRDTRAAFFKLEVYSRVEGSELDVHDILTDMVEKKEVEAKPRQSSGVRRGDRFTLTLKGWGEYLQVLSSIYELPE